MSSSMNALSLVSEDKNDFDFTNIDNGPIPPAVDQENHIDGLKLHLYDSTLRTVESKIDRSKPSRSVRSNEEIFRSPSKRLHDDCLLCLFRDSQPTSELFRGPNISTDESTCKSGAQVTKAQTIDLTGKESDDDSKKTFSQEEIIDLTRELPNF